jgi:Family of unknown function (DUF6600)
MKRILVTLFAIASLHSVSSAHGTTVSFGVFYSSLGHHGEWISIAPSVYAWRPAHVVHGWRPYTVGRWAWTNDGWYWLSDEPWGWATYHYGRWYYDDYYGWMWLPGYEWAPAWVEWRYGGDYVGWAPLGPYAVFSINFGIYYRTRWSTPYYYWSFVDCRYIATPSVHRYVYRSDNNTRLIGRTRGAGSVRFDGGRVVTRGPERGYVEQRANIRLRSADIVDVQDQAKAGLVRSDGRERIEAYRPSIDRRATGDDGPQNLRQADRETSLDMRYTALRSREIDRESGRDMRRAEEYRTRIERRAPVQGGSDESARSVTPRSGKTEDRGQIERRSPAREDEKAVSPSDRSRRGSEQPRQQNVEPGRSQKSPSVNRNQERRPQTRSSKPERSVRRSDPPKRESGRSAPSSREGRSNGSRERKR